MKKIHLVFLPILIFSIYFSGCAQSTNVEMSKSDEEIENEILEKMSCDIYDCDVVDFNIEKDNNVQLTTVKLNNTAFNFLYDNLESEENRGDGHFFLSYLPAWSSDLYFRNTDIDNNWPIDETNNENNYYCIFENDDSVKLYIFFSKSSGVWQSYGYYIYPSSNKYKNPATNFYPTIQQVDK